MPSSKPEKGVNDLATLCHAIAAEADGWDPSRVTSSSGKKMPWKCKEGHQWIAVISARTNQSQGCPVCTNRKVWVGFNDLKTKFPELAAEADGWDPSTVLAGTHKKMPWKCKKGHTWEVSIINRSYGKSGCPYCSNKKAWKGFNDLETKFPELAAEADGWDPSTVTYGSGKKMPWKCKEGHTWRANINNRSSNNKGCPYCANQKLWKGFNDLKTKFPEIAAEADGWDPTNVIAGAHKRLPWKCKEGHTWKNTVVQRSYGKRGCPYCANYKLWIGFNDLKTKFPEVAAEADGWDPSSVIAGAHKRLPWKCKEGHIWKAVLSNRTSRLGRGCPYCANYKLWIGFNDLKTKFPKVAAEADGWDPSTFLAGHYKKMPWKCKEGHKWETTITNRTSGDGSGCPACAEYGFNPEKPAWFYLMRRKNEQQFGITNDIVTRMQTHKSKGWKEVDKIGPKNGQLVLNLESELKKWLKEKIGLVEGTTENWLTTNMEVHSLVELKEISRIETSLF